MDLPKAASGTDVQVVFSAVIGADGKLLVDSKAVPDDDAIFALAREAHTKNPDVRAVIKADSSIPHGRVIHILDLMKQAGIAKIAFGVSPTAAQPGAALPKPATP
jgi:biopolymer transport protein ExbD